MEGRQERQANPGGRRGASGAARQADVLRGEGVDVGRGSLGELTVDLAVYGWFPESLPRG